MDYTNTLLMSDISGDALSDIKTHQLMFDKLLALKDNLQTYGYDAGVVAYIKTDTALMETLGLTDDEFNASSAGVCENLLASIWNGIVKTIDWIISKIVGFFELIWRFITTHRKIQNMTADKVRVDRAKLAWDRLPNNTVLTRIDPNDTSPLMIPDFRDIKTGLRALNGLLNKVIVFTADFKQIMQLWYSGPVSKYDIIQLVNQLGIYNRIDNDRNYTPQQSSSTLTHKITDYVTHSLLETSNTLRETLTITDKIVNISTPSLPKHEARVKSDFHITYKSELSEVMELGTNLADSAILWEQYAKTLVNFCQDAGKYIKAKYTEAQHNPTTRKWIEDNWIATGNDKDNSLQVFMDIEYTTLLLVSALLSIQNAGAVYHQMRVDLDETIINSLQ